MNLKSQSVWKTNHDDFIQVKCIMEYLQQYYLQQEFFATVIIEHTERGNVLQLQTYNAF